MKNIFYLLTIFSLMFASCTPLEDVYDELDAQGQENPIVGDVIYTLVKDDYTNKIDDGGLGLKFANLGSENEAKEFLPAFLSNKYPALGKGSSAKLTYKVYFKKNDEKSLRRYTVTGADYTAQGLSFPNFSSSDQITAFLNTKYPTPANRLLVSLTYKYYNGSVSTLNNGFIYVDGAWQMHTGITDAEYKAMGEGRPQFSSEEEALEKIPLLLKDKLKFEGKVAGDIEGVMYKLYVDDVQDVDEDGKTDDKTVYSFVVFFIYDGANWSKYNNTIDQTLQFGFEAGKWLPDNTIKYTLTNADFALVGNGSFNNFDVRAGKDEETVDARLVKINTILLKNFPQYGEKQKFSVSYAVWKPGDDVFVMHVIHDGTKYVLQ